jgi:hypothetical protein
MPTRSPGCLRFIEAVYTNAAESRAYKVYIPSLYRGRTILQHEVVG